MTRPLTHQQQAVYNFIREKIVARGYGPTVREIGEHMNIKSPNGVMCHLRALERKGMLTRTANKSRAIELTEPISGLMGGSLPIGGRVVGGLCMPQSDMPLPLELGSLVAAERYLLVVGDDSFLSAQIRAGDYLLIQKQPTAVPGQLAVIRVGEDEMRLRVWTPPVGGDSSSVVPTSVPPEQVIGVVVSVVRLYSGWSAK
ncbi:MAG: repressor LexA [Pirellulaceae bacterium]